MARILYGSMVTSIKGSIGGLTFHNNASGAIARLKPNRNQNANAKQSQSKATFAQAIAAWSTLSHADQTAWNTVAASAPKINYWDESKAVTGFNLFTSLYINAVSVEAAPRTSAPTLGAPLAVPNFGISFSSSSLNVLWSGGFVHMSDYLLIFASPPLMSVGIKNRKLLRLIKVVPPGATSTESILTEWLATFGYSAMPATGTRGYFIQVSIASIQSTYFYNSPYNSINKEIIF